ncbi:hypothetical protein C8Q80DRAFT_1265086 [Daedaleopsis nitida]|nr:hypothetical protein C8Q80DRAFT_1265086 [Daedaleopsis nitida]
MVSAVRGGQFVGAHGAGDGMGHLDPFTKQMAALQATSLAKAGNRSAPGGTSAGYFGGMASSETAAHSRPDDSHAFPPLPDLQAPNPHMNVRPFLPPDSLPFHSPRPPFPTQPPQIPQQPPNGPVHPDLVRQRKRSWLQGLGTLMAQRNLPLPPQLTGVPFPPGYDPVNMPWKSLEVSPTDLGVIRLAGKDVDLFRLWGIVINNGGGQATSAKGLWPNIRDTLALPETMPAPNNPAEQQPLVSVLERYYSALLGPFEEAYRKNIEQQNQRAMAGRQLNAQTRNGMVGGNPVSGMMPRPNGPPIMDNSIPGAGLMPNGTGVNGTGMPIHKMQPGGLPNGTTDLEHDLESRKRKMLEVNDPEAKRVRQKTGGSDVSDSRAAGVDGVVGPTVTRTIRQPSRRKIEYVPLAPELDTHGGRNLDFIQNEWARVAARPLRHSDEWGHVDIDALTLSLRSRISIELSYSLTTFALLTLPRNQHPSQHPRDRDRDSGFPIAQAPDLLDEAVDLVEDLAFDGVPDVCPSNDNSPFMTHKELVNSLLEDNTNPFAGLQPGPGVKDADRGPRQRPADIILTVVNIIRNISQGEETSAAYLAKHDKLVHVMLRLCALAPRDQSSAPVPLSPKLTLQDVLSIRKDVVHMLVNFGAFLVLLTDNVPTKQMQLTIRRAFEVLASFLVDPSETISPFQYVVQTGIHMSAHQPRPPAPPSLANQALEAFARFALTDDNRRAIAQTVPHPWIWTTIQALVHRLPVTDHDFHAIMREPWIGYVERLVLCLYSLAFLSPPEIKRRAKRDGALGFSKVVLRILRKLTLHTPPDSRQTFAGLIRRAIELLKVVDDAEDSFDASRSAMPLLSFGVGYGEHGDNRVERGMGMLSAYQEDVTLGLMMHHEVVDAMLFSELESLARVGR